MDNPVYDRPVAPFSQQHCVFFVPILVLHLACFLVFLVGVSPTAVVVFAASAFIRCFGITAGYHRLLAHRAYRTSRAFRFILASFGALAAQNGPLWWVSHHRQHHRYSDSPNDCHSPRRGFFWSHMGWLFSPSAVNYPHAAVPDLRRCPELVFLQRYHHLLHLLYAILLFALGEFLRRAWPAADTNGYQLLVWGGVVSTVCVYHAIWSANSVCHSYGSRRFNTKDCSRNNWLVAIFTLGDGWHNNHHFRPRSAAHGFYRWEIDVNYFILRALERVGLVWDLVPPPPTAETGSSWPGPVPKATK